MNCSPVESFRKNVKMAKSSGSLVRPQRKREGQKISKIDSNWSCFKLVTFRWRANTYRRDSYCLARVFQNLPAPPKQYGVFDVFCAFQSFFQLVNLGSHLAMCPGDRFLPQGKQILPEICQVRCINFTIPDIFQCRHFVNIFLGK